ncbi:MAG: hypothetical protein WAM53_13005 [Terrimicrobiaceae bacterium]
MQASSFPPFLLVALLLSIGLTCRLNAEEKAKPEEGPPKAPFDTSQAQSSRLPLPSPYDKMLAIEMAAKGKKIQWGKVYDAVAIDVDANSCPDKTSAALALGVKIADGLVAVKSQDVEKLNSCATQIESIAKKLGAGDEELKRARLVREGANKGKWLDVFLELGFLQADIMKILNRQENANDRKLIIASGWMQGARHITYYLIEHYDAEISNVLREPLLVGELSKEIKELPAQTLAHPRVKALPQAFEQALPLVSVGKDQAVSKENVAKLKTIADAATKSALDQ